MSKDKLPPVREDYDESEWGNLGDESMHDASWNRKKSQSQKDAIARFNKQRHADPKIKKQLMKGLDAIWQDPQKAKEHIKKMQAGVTDEILNNRLNSTVNNSEWRKKYGVQNRWKDPAFRQKITKANSGPKDPVSKRSNFIGRGIKPFKCPWGYYDTPVQASNDSLEKTGTFKSAKYIRIRLNRIIQKDFEGYDYITWKEYDDYHGLKGLPQD